MYTLEKVYDKKQAKESENAEICRVAVCVALPEADPKEVVEDLQKLAKTGKIRKGIPVEYVAVPSPLLCPESGETLRKADAFLLAVPAGERVGKRLEAVLEYLHTQDCSVDGAFLWNADEQLIRSYYFCREPCRHRIQNTEESRHEGRSSGIGNECFSSGDRTTYEPAIGCGDHQSVRPAGAGGNADISGERKNPFLQFSRPWHRQKPQ